MGSFHFDINDAIFGVYFNRHVEELSGRNHSLSYGLTLRQDGIHCSRAVLRAVQGSRCMGSMLFPDGSCCDVPCNREISFEATVVFQYLGASHLPIYWLLVVSRRFDSRTAPVEEFSLLIIRLLLTHHHQNATRV